MADSVPLFLLALLGGTAVLGLFFFAGLAFLKEQRDAAGRFPAVGEGPWVVLRTFNTPEAAHLAKARLEVHGLPVRLANEHVVGTDWLYGVAVGVDLRVPEVHAADADRLLSHRPEADPVSPEPGVIETWEEDAWERPRPCQRCGRDEVYRERRGWRWSLLDVVLLGLPLLLPRRYRCDACGHWQKEPEPARGQNPALPA